MTLDTMMESQQLTLSLQLFAKSNGLPDTDTDSDTDSDYKPNGYIALCKTCHTTWSQIQIPIQTTDYNNAVFGKNLAK